MAMSENIDMLKMQEEALRRAREMQSRARPPNDQQPQQKGRRGKTENKQNPPVTNTQVKDEPQPAGEISETQSLFDSLLKDKDKTLIIALLVLLSESGENANHELLFSLMFLLM